MGEVSAAVIQGNAAELWLPDASVDLIVTSPPFWSLRSYQDNGEHIGGQIGAEATPAEYIDNLITCTREWMRVLKPTGSLWVNLGDKYAGSAGYAKGAATEATSTLGGRKQQRIAPIGNPVIHDAGVRTKSLIGLPWRYAIRCVDELGLILRAEVIWSKPNGLPESVRDRVRRSHEQWFHFVLSPRYYSAVDAIREAYAPDTAARYASGYHTNSRTAAEQQSTPSIPLGVGGLVPNALGKLPGSVWTIATQPLRVPAELGIDHFAAFPMEWPRRIILGWSPSGICTVCGEGRRPSCNNVDNRKATVITGEECSCPDTSAPTTPAIVLDPFGGTGTTALVASVLGRRGISVDLSADYCRLAVWRTNDPAQRERAQRVPKKPTVARAA